MNNECTLSNVTLNYLTEFNDILGRMISGMREAVLTDSISYNFIVQMIPHHKAAIEMSENILKYTTNIQIQNIALNIISEQTKSIENMQNIKCTCESAKSCDKDLCGYSHKIDSIINTMFIEMGKSLITNNINLNFISEMIPHHRGAVRMSKTALNFDICSELKPILCSIISSQQKGIITMSNLMRCINCG